MCFFFQKYGYTHLSAGELLRDERKNPDSQYGELIEKYIKDGKIVPVEITISLLRRVRSVNANQFKPTRKWEIKSSLSLSNGKIRVLNFLLVEGGHGSQEWQNWKFHFRLGSSWTEGSILCLGLGSATTQHSFVCTWPFSVCRQSILLFLFLLPFLLLFSPSSFLFSVSFLPFFLPPVPPSHDPPTVAILSVVMFPFLVYSSPSSVRNAETNSYQTKIGPIWKPDTLGLHDSPLKILKIIIINRHFHVQEMWRRNG